MILLIAGGVVVVIGIILWGISKCKVSVIEQGDPAHMQEYLDAKSLIIKASMPKEVKRK